MLEIRCPFTLSFLHKRRHGGSGREGPRHALTCERLDITGGIAQQQKAVSGEQTRTSGQRRRQLPARRLQSLRQSKACLIENNPCSTGHTPCAADSGSIESHRDVESTILTSNQTDVPTTAYGHVNDAGFVGNTILLNEAASSKP